MKGHIRQRGKGSWAIVLDLGRDSDGRRRQKWHTVRGTKKDAQRELSKLLHELNTGAYVAPARMTVGEYLEQWLSDYAAHNIGGKTFERYGDIVRSHLKPAIGQLPLTKLQPLHIQGFYSKALREGRRDGRGGLSPRTVLHCHRVLNTALRQAVRWRLLATNPAEAVEPPRPPHREMRALDETETVKLLNAAKRSRLYRPIFLALTTGLRRGELLALRWDAVDLDRGLISIREALEETRQGLRFKRPKTARSRRSVDLPAIGVEELRRHKAEQAEHKLKLGPAYQDHNLVFAEPDGQPWPPDKLTSAFAGLVRRSGFGSLRLHDLRHTHATQLLTQGVHPKVVSERLGHATIAITLDTYSHVLPGLQKEAATLIDSALRLALENHNSAG